MRGELAENVAPQGVHAERERGDQARAGTDWSEPAARADAGGKPLGKFPKGRARRDKVAGVAGIARRTIEKTEAIVAAAEAEPEKFGKLVEDMDRTGRVNGPYRRLKNPAAGRGDPRRTAADAGYGPYRAAHDRHPVGLRAGRRSGARRAAVPNTVHRAGLRARHRLDHAPKPCCGVGDQFHLGAWPAPTGATRMGLRAEDGRDMAEGSRRSRPLAEGPDRTPRHGHARQAGRRRSRIRRRCCRGRFIWCARALTAQAGRGIHYIESLCPAPRYADLFSRYRHNDKWDCHGNEAPPPATAPARSGLDIVDALIG